MRPTRRSSRSRPRSSSRRSSASAPRASATCSQSQGGGTRRSSSSTSSTRSAAPARARFRRRRQRRARADARPDPHRDRRIRASRGGDRARRDQPRLRSSTRRCCGPGALTAASRCSHRTGRARGRSWRCTRARSRSAPSVDLEAIAASTPGMVGADLANLANEAALLAARRNHERSRRPTSPTRWRRSCSASPRGIVLSPADRERTAYHEAGHALVGMLTPGADPVRKVSIIPRGMALGVTLATPDSDQVSYSRRSWTQDQGRARRTRRGGDGLRDDHDGSGVDIEQLTRSPGRWSAAWGMSDAIGPSPCSRGSARAVHRRARRDLRGTQRLSTKRSAGSSTTPTRTSPRCSAAPRAARGTGQALL